MLGRVADQPAGRERRRGQVEPVDQRLAARRAGRRPPARAASSSCRRRSARGTPPPRRARRAARRPSMAVRRPNRLVRLPGLDHPTASCAGCCSPTARCRPSRGQEARPDHLHPRRHEHESAEGVEHHEERQQQAHLGLELEVREPPEDRAGEHRGGGEDDGLAGGGGGVVDRLVEVAALVDGVDHATEVIDAVVDADARARRRDRQRVHVQVDVPEPHERLAGELREDDGDHQEQRRHERAVGEVEARRDGDHHHDERRPVGVLDRLVHRREHAEEPAGAAGSCTFSLECCAAHCFALSIAFMMMSCE